MRLFIHRFVGAAVVLAGVKLAVRQALTAAIAAVAVIVAPACDRVAPDDPAVATEAAASGPTVALELISDGFVAPVHLTTPPDGTGRLFVVDQIGLVHVLTPQGDRLAEPFLDLRDRMVTLREMFDERGLLGLAFHPGFEENGRFFVYYGAPLRAGGPEGFDHTSHVSEFRVSLTDPDVADPGSERIVLQVDQPQFNQNGGHLAFGPDGLLYVGLGDGGGANDVGPGHTPHLGNGQDFTNLLGSVLRIDVAAGVEPYAIPADNPFVGAEGRDEIFAYGFRNPYRFSFDPEHGLLAGDAGQNLWEEVSVVERGGNYGWNIKEGTHCFDPDEPFESPETCRDTGPLLGEPLIDPVVEYPNIRHPEVDGIGLAVIGGHVYRGRDVPQLHGRYVFGDWSTSFLEPDGTLLLAKPRSDRPWQVQELRVAHRRDGRLGHYVLSLGQDERGELYVLTTDRTGPTGASGRMYKMVAPGAP